MDGVNGRLRRAGDLKKQDYFKRLIVGVIAIDWRFSFVYVIVDPSSGLRSFSA